MGRSKRPLTVNELAAMGGKARAKALTKEQRQAAAKKAIAARWAKKRSTPD
jgi:hypothetical protein